MIKSLQDKLTKSQKDFMELNLKWEGQYGDLQIKLKQKEDFKS